MDGNERSFMPADLEEVGLIHDWNKVATPERMGQPLTVDDETLRDGMQSASIGTPSIEQKMELIRLMVKLGIQTADLGLPGTGRKAFDDVKRLIDFIVQERLPIEPRCAARTVVSDIRPIAELQQACGVPVWCDAFIGSSPIRQVVERWDEARLEAIIREALTFALKNNLPTMFVTEDSTRSTPDHLRTLYLVAMECGVKRLCLADTVGFATPEGTKLIVTWLRGLVRQAGMESEVKLDWHGHRDRGLAVANCLAAIQVGVHQVHATALGVGERCGNTAMELLLSNMFIEGLWPHDLRHIREYCRLASEMTGLPIPRNNPVTGADAFVTGTGVHAAAVYKAFKQGHHWLADRVYSSIPAREVGRLQRIQVSPQSGMYAARWVVRNAGGDPDDDALCRLVLNKAHATGRALTDTEVQDICNWYYA